MLIQVNNNGCHSSWRLHIRTEKFPSGMRSALLCPFLDSKSSVHKKTEEFLCFMCQYKVVEGKSNRRYTDEKLVAEAVKAAGKNPYSEPEVLGITAMTKLLGGKKKFDELLSKSPSWKRSILR